MSRILNYQAAQKYRTFWRSRLGVSEASPYEMSLNKQNLSHVRRSKTNITEKWVPEDLLLKIQEKMPSKIGLQMLDEGILEAVCQTSREDIPPLINGVMNKYSKRRDLHEVKTCFSLISKLKGILPKSCEICLFPKARCVCSHIRTVRPKHKLWVFQGASDYGRKNNSATLLCLVTGAQRTLRGFQEQENELLCHIAKYKKSTIIVFPSEVAVDVEDFATQVEVNSNEEPQTLILLDGTWGDAANMDKFLPRDIKRVKLSSEDRTTWLYPMRGQSRSDRVCTAQGKQTHFDSTEISSTVEVATLDQRH